MAELQTAGIPEQRIVLMDRSITDEPPAKKVEPPVRAWERPRDVRAVRTVFTRAVLFAVILAASGALVGFLIGLAVFHHGIGLAMAAIVGAVAGGVAGAVSGEIWGSMDEAKREGGVLVEVECSDEAEAGRAAAAIGQTRPLRIERTGGEGPGP